MRRNARAIGISSRSVIEQLEGRTLLSAAWLGAWKITGLNLNGGDGHLEHQMMNLNARITNGATADQFIVRVTGSGVDDTFTVNGDDQRLQVNLPDAGETLVLVNMGPGAIGVMHSSIEPATGPVADVSFFSGIGTRGPAPTVALPWEGTYHGHNMGFEFQQNGDPQIQWYNDDSDVVGRPNGSGGFLFGDTEDADTFLPNGNRLIHQQGGFVGVDLCEDHYGIILHGPYGRLYHVGGEIQHHVSNGALVSAHMDASFTDPPSNICPFLNKSGAPALNPINEDDPGNAGTSIADMLFSGGSGYVYDPNPADSVGIALVGADTKNGSWQYQLDGGAWQNLPKVTPASALLLPPSALIRLVPRTNFFGTINKALSFRAWDQSDGKAPGTPTSVNASGKTTAFSSASDTASLQVRPVNDAPAISGDPAPIAYRAGGTAVSIFSGMKITDPDSPLLNKVTVTFAGAVAGTDQVTYKMPKGITITPSSQDGLMKLTITPTGGTPMKISAFVAALNSIKFSTPNGGRVIPVTISVLDQDANGNDNKTTNGLQVINIS